VDARRKRKNKNKRKHTDDVGKDSRVSVESRFISPSATTVSSSRPSKGKGGGGKAGGVLALKRHVPSNRLFSSEVERDLPVAVDNKVG